MTALHEIPATKHGDRLPTARPAQPASAAGHAFAVADALAEVQPLQIQESGYQTTTLIGRRWSAVD